MAGNNNHHHVDTVVNTDIGMKLYMYIYILGEYQYRY